MLLHGSTNGKEETIKSKATATKKRAKPATLDPPRHGRHQPTKAAHLSRHILPLGKGGSQKNAEIGQGVYEL